MSYRSQAVASVILGTPLAFALCGVYATLGPAEPATNYIAALFLLLPVWCGVLIWGLSRQRARQAWMHLGTGCAVMVCVFLVMRLLPGA
ncbi:hypothetical protein [Thauera linaloolentis]|uniref:Transmembrane protein n=1 Tax=Thauera linaloolentis (strain DSM 12138 / JCM 21573 / CCUG 41526 / CIP 105981 / IAM 15112 / NBRC 102519 / 47Lol) TaxID=1123367 RepID=N6XYT6_THAL4|nr:hypothetical protein [Thauera linaloolentis]ENO86976.1 hypothetical protein C666_12030 [Thauera linaloolentis 47Lol = DSM 12138]MCM8564436.1 hypothetical protein [Thauera linaloolentis]